MSRGAGSASAPTKVLICQKSGQIHWKSGQNPGKNGAQRCLTWKNGAQHLQKNTRGPFLKVTSKNCQLSHLCIREAYFHAFQNNDQMRHLRGTPKTKMAYGPALPKSASVWEGKISWSAILWIRRQGGGNGGNCPPNSESSTNNFQVNQAFYV